MMRDAEKTISNLIDKQGVSFIASISEDGFPNMKAMLPPRKRVGIREFYFTTNTSSLRWPSFGKSKRQYLLLRQTLLPGSHANRPYGGAGRPRQQRNDLAGRRHHVLPGRSD